MTASIFLKFFHTQYDSKKKGVFDMGKRTKNLLNFKYAEELTKSAFIIISTLLLTAPLLNSFLISLAIAEVFCALAFMPDLKEGIKNFKKINTVFNYIVPAVLLLFIIIFNIENVKFIFVSSVISFVIALLTIKSESVFHSIGMLLLPVAQFVAIEGSRGNLEKITEGFKNAIESEHFVDVFLFYLTSIGVFYALHNISFIIFKKKKLVFSVFGILSVIFSVVNAVSIVFLNKIFEISLISDLTNILKNTTDWTVYLNTATLFNTSVVSALLFAILYFPFMNALTSESQGFLTFRERIARCILGCLLLIVCVIVMKGLFVQLQTVGISFPDFLTSSIILNTN